MLQPGQPAPDFKLFDSDKNEVQLSALKGRPVLLLFFPLAFTGTCTKELCSVRDDIGTYNNVNAAVYGISVDSVYSLGKYRTEQNLNFPLLSDFNRTASRAYDSIYESFGNMAMEGVSKRSAFVIDKNGMIRYAEVLENAGEIPNFEEINKILNQL